MNCGQCHDCVVLTMEMAHEAEVAELRAEIAAKDAEIERLRAENADKVETIQRESELRGAQHGAGQARREVVNYLRSIGQHLAAQGVIERCKWPNGTQINNNEEIK